MLYATQKHGYLHDFNTTFITTKYFFERVIKRNSKSQINLSDLSHSKVQSRCSKC